MTIPWGTLNKLPVWGRWAFLVIWALGMMAILYFDFLLIRECWRMRKERRRIELELNREEK